MSPASKALAALMTAALTCGALASCSSGNTPSGSTAPDGTSSVSPSTSDTSFVSSTSHDTSSDPGTTVESTAPDWSKIDLEVSDYASMENFRTKASNGDYDGKVIKITAVSEKLGSHYSIMQHDTNGTGIGLTYKIAGAKDEDYPADDTKVTVTGVMVVDTANYGARYLEVPADRVQVLE